MSKNLRIKLLSLLCVQTFAAADPWPGVLPSSAPCFAQGYAGHGKASSYANATVAVTADMPAQSTYANRTITYKNSGASADFDFGFKHAAIIGAIVAVGAFVIATEDAHHFFGNIKAFLYRICGRK
jgi:hypothetical protein